MFSAFRVSRSWAHNSHILVSRRSRGHDGGGRSYLRLEKTGAIVAEAIKRTAVQAEIVYPIPVFPSGARRRRGPPESFRVCNEEGFEPEDFLEELPE